MKVRVSYLAAVAMLWCGVSTHAQVPNRAQPAAKPPLVVPAAVTQALVAPAPRMIQTGPIYAKGFAVTLPSQVDTGLEPVRNFVFEA